MRYAVHAEYYIIPLFSLQKQLIIIISLFFHSFFVCLWWNVTHIQNYRMNYYHQSVFASRSRATKK